MSESRVDNFNKISNIPKKKRKEDDALFKCGVEKIEEKMMYDSHDVLFTCRECLMYPESGLY